MTLPGGSQRLQLIQHLPEQQLIGHGHDINGHIWLSAENLVSIAQLISHQLVKLNPAQAELYTYNSNKLIERIQQWKSKTQASLASSDPRYILDHPFLEYFEHSFKLNNAGTLRHLHDHGSSIRQLSVLNQKLKEHAVSCLLVSRLPISKQARQMSEQHHLEVLHIDILDDRDQFSDIIELLDDIAKKLNTCQ